VRRRWLVGKGTPLSHTVYRMDTFRSLIAGGAWDLALPLRVRGIRLDEDTLGTPTPHPASAYVEEARRPILRLGGWDMPEEDVRALQTALLDNGFSDVAVDGDFGPRTAAAVQAVQRRTGIKIDGVVGPATWAAPQA